MILNNIFFAFQHSYAISVLQDKKYHPKYSGINHR